MYPGKVVLYIVSLLGFMTFFAPHEILQALAIPQDFSVVGLLIGIAAWFLVTRISPRKGSATPSSIRSRVSWVVIIVGVIALVADRVLSSVNALAVTLFFCGTFLCAVGIIVNRARIS